MPEDKPEDKLKPIDEEVTDPRGKGKDTLYLEREQLRADDAQEKLVEVLQEQVKSERSGRTWMMRIFVASFVLILVMLGVSVGLVKNGTIGIFGIGTVEIGDVSDEPPSHEPALEDDSMEDAVLDTGDEP